MVASGRQAELSECVTLCRFLNYLKCYRTSQT